MIPNLELLKFKAELHLMALDAFRETLDSKKKENQFTDMNLDVIVFPQLWGSTCTGFDETKDGTPVIACSAMTNAYTTVFHETLTDYYIVFFGDDACYVVEDASQKFFDDLNNRNMAPLSRARKEY